MTRLPPFQTLVDDHGADVWRFLCATVGPGAAPDCYQETFLAALRAYPDLRNGDNLRAWLVTIAHRKALDSWRAESRRPLPVATPGPPGSSASPSAEPGAAPGPEPPDEPLWAAVASLPDKQRAAVALRYVADLAYAEVAAALGCSEDAARQNVRAALTRLRTRLTPEDHHA